MGIEDIFSDPMFNPAASFEPPHVTPPGSPSTALGDYSQILGLPGVGSVLSALGARAMVVGGAVTRCFWGLPLGQDVDLAVVGDAEWSTLGGILVGAGYQMETPPDNRGQSPDDDHLSSTRALFRGAGSVYIDALQVRDLDAFLASFDLSHVQVGLQASFSGGVQRTRLVGTPLGMGDLARRTMRVTLPNSTSTEARIEKYRALGFRLVSP